MAKKAKKEEFTEVKKTNVIEATSTELYDEVFTIVNHNGEFLIAIGNSIVTRKKFNSLEEAKNYVNSKPWDIILNATAIMFNNLKNMQQ